MPSGQKKTFLTKLTDVYTTDKEGVGTIRFEGNKIYKWVWFRNHTATVAGAAGDPVGYYADGYSSHKVCADMSDADAAPLGAGILQAAVTGTLDTDYYCWIQIKGAATVNQALAGTPAAGNKLIMSTTDLTLTKSTAAVDQGCAYAQVVANKTILCDFPW